MEWYFRVNLTNFCERLINQIHFLIKCHSLVLGVRLVERLTTESKSFKNSGFPIKSENDEVKELLIFGY